MFKKIILSKKYWITVTFFGLGFLGFIVIYSFIKHLMQYGGIDIGSFLNEKIYEGRWTRYVVSRIIGGLLYGMIMGYYFEIRKQKSNR